MRIRLVIVAMFVVASAAAASVPVRCRVSVIGFDERPLAGLPITVVVGDDSRSATAWTDERGVAVVDADLETPSVATVIVGLGRDARMVSQQRGRELSARYDELHRRYFWEAVDIRIGADQHDVDVIIRADEAVVVHGRIDQSPDESTFVFTTWSVRFDYALAHVQGVGDFDALGLPKGRAVVLYAVQPRRGRARRITLSPDQMAGTPDLGLIQYDMAPRSARIHASLDHLDGLRPRGVRVQSGVTLIGESGGIYPVMMNNPKTMSDRVHTYEGPFEPTVPPGRYVVLPGNLMPGLIAAYEPLIDAIVNGVDATALGVECVVMVEGRNELALDAIRLHDQASAAMVELAKLRRDRERPSSETMTGQPGDPVRHR